MGGEQAVTCEAKLGLLQLLAPLDGLPLSMGDNNAESRCVSWCISTHHTGPYFTLLQLIYHSVKKYIVENFSDTFFGHKETCYACIC